MQRNTLIVSIASYSLLLSSVPEGMGQPSAAVCDASGGPEICVRLDNLPNPPQEGQDFELTFDGSGIPSVALLRGDDGLGTLYKWRVWSRVSSSDPTEAAIGSVTSPGAFNYWVSILNDNDGPGASVVGEMSLVPGDAGKWSRIAAGDITGDLNGNILLQGSAGRCALDVGGDVTGAITIATADGLVIGGNVIGDISITNVKELTISGNTFGTVTVTRVVFSTAGDVMRISGSLFDSLTIGEIEEGSFVILGDLLTFNCVSGAGTAVFAPISVGILRDGGRLTINSHLHHDLTIDELHGVMEQFGNVRKLPETGGTENVTIVIKDLSQVATSSTVARFAVGPPLSAPCSFYADLHLENGVPGNTSVSVLGTLEANSTIDMNFLDVAGDLQQAGPGSGSIINGGTVTGTGTVQLGDGFTGTATFMGLEEGDGQLEGVIGTVTGDDWDAALVVTGSVGG